MNIHENEISEVSREKLPKPDGAKRSSHGSYKHVIPVHASYIYVMTWFLSPMPGRYIEDW